MARVIENPLLRGIAVAFDWIAEHSWPSATFTSRALAEEWVLARISADGKRRPAPRLPPVISRADSLRPP